MKFLSNSLKDYWQRAKDFCVFKVLHADDPPHRLALGIAIGLFVTFLPLMGIQMALSFFLAWLLGANKLVGIPLVWISNPLTIAPIYIPCYALGCKLLGMPVTDDDYSRIVSAISGKSDMTWGSFLHLVWDGLLQFAGPLGVGSLVVSTVFGVLGYYISLFMIRNYRMRRWGQLMPPSLTPVDVEDDAEVVSSKESGNAA